MNVRVSIGIKIKGSGEGVIASSSSVGTPNFSNFIMKYYVFKQLRSDRDSRCVRMDIRSNRVSFYVIGDLRGDHSSLTLNRCKRQVILPGSKWFFFKIKKAFKIFLIYFFIKLLITREH